MSKQITLEETIERLRNIILENKKEEIENFLSNTPFIDITDYKFHLEVSKILSSLGKEKLARKELELAIRDNPKDPTPYIIISELIAEEGNYKKAAKVLKKAIEIFPKEEEIYIKLGNLYKAQGELGSLKSLYSLAYEHTKNPYFKREIIELYTEPQEKILKPSNIHLVKFLDLFKGRGGIYARQWIDNMGNTGYSPIKEPLTINIVKNHLLGNYTVGIYQLREDDTISFIIFDIDIKKKFLKEYLSSESMHKKMDKTAFEVAQNISSFLKDEHIYSYIEYSGFKGYHVWLFFKQFIPASLGKEVGQYILAKFNELYKENKYIKIELFPKQSSLKSRESLGHLIKLPLGIHRRSGNRSLFYDPSGNPIKDQLSFLLDIETNEKSVIESLFDKLKKELSLNLKEESIISESEEIEKEFTLEDDKEFNLIIKRCPVIRALYNKVEINSGLNGDEVTVVIFTLGHLLNGPKIVNTLLKKGGIFDEKSYLKSKLKGYPMSCPKIKKKIPYITINTCRDCFDNEEINTYPNPLLHLKEFEKEEKDIDIIALEYIDIFKKYKIIQNNLIKAKRELLSLMEERGISEIKIQNMEIERTENGNDLYIRTRVNFDKKIQKDSNKEKQ